MKRLDSISLCSFWSKEKLIQRYEEIGSRALERGFRQKAITEGELLFSHFRDCVKYNESIPMWQFAYTGVDLSGEKRKGNVIVTSGVDVNGNRFVIDIQYGNWSSPEMAEKIKEINSRLKPLAIMVENNAYQQSIIDWMNTKGYQNIPLRAFTTGKQKSDTEIGLPALDVQFERKQWTFYLPEHQVGCGCAWCQFKREMESYPIYSSTDFVMAFWFSEQAIRKYHQRNTFDDVKIKSKDYSVTAGFRNMQF